MRRRVSRGLRRRRRESSLYGVSSTGDSLMPFSWGNRIPNGHVRKDPKTMWVTCTPDTRPTMQEMASLGRLV